MSKELRALWDNISSGNYKQAQVKINKELKKQPNNAYFMAVSAYVFNKTKKTDQALEIARKVAAAAPPNVAVLSVLTDLFRELELYAEMSGMLETANRKDPNNSQVLELWYSAVVECCYIRGIQKVTMAIQKVSGERVDQFGAVLSMYLAFNDPEIDDNDPSKKLLPMLANRFLQNLQPLKSPQEAYVNAMALKMLGVDKLVEYLRSEDAKKWGSLDLEVLLVDTLEQQGQWQALFEETISKVKNENSNNYIYWRGLVCASVKTNQSNEIKHLLTGSRNGDLAYVELCSQLNDGLYDALLQYFVKYGKKRACFNDLLPYITKVDSSKLIKSFEEQLPQDAGKSQDSMNQLVNIAKFKHNLGVGVASTSENVKLYKSTAGLLESKDQKDYHSGCDLLLIEASKLIEASSEGDRYTNFLKAIMLLEVAAKDDKHNFYVKTMLIQLYIQIGAFKPAEFHYNSLSIKMMQEETLSYLLATRISSIFPQLASGLIQKSMRFYNDTEQFPNYIKVAFKRGSFSQIEGFIDLQNKLGNSLNRVLLEIESIKSIRISTKQDPATGSIEKIKGDQLQDNRDFESLWHYVDHSQKQTCNWALVMQLREKVIRRLVNDTDGDLEGVLANLEATIAAGTTTTEENLTKQEKWSVDVIIALGKSALDKSKDKLYEGILGDGSIPKFVTEAPAVDWSYFHSLFTVMETCKVINGYISRLKGARHQVKFSSSAVDQLQTCVNATMDEIKKLALATKDSRNARFQKLVDELAPWIESQISGSASLAETVVDDILSSQDLQLTNVRSV